MKRWEVWRGSRLSASHDVRDEFRWRWRARLSAWLRTKAGWAHYEVRDGLRDVEWADEDPGSHVEVTDGRRTIGHDDVLRPF